MADEFDDVLFQLNKMFEQAHSELEKKDKTLSVFLPRVSPKKIIKWKMQAYELPESEVLLSEQGKPLMLFHGTPYRFEEFYPLSHFGTLNAAKDAALKSDGIPVDMPPKPDDFKGKLFDWIDYCKVKSTQFIPVCLKMRRPLIAADIIKHDAERYGLLVRNELEKESYSLLMKSQYPVLQELAIAGVLMGYKQTQVPPVYQMIFKDPYQMTPEQIARELRLETLFKVCEPFKGKSRQCSWNACTNLTNLVYQRMIRFFERRGYDGIQYLNRCEDKGKLSYIVFRPEQVIRLDRDLPKSFAPRRRNQAKEKKLNALELAAIERCTAQQVDEYDCGEDKRYQEKLRDDNLTVQHIIQKHREK